MTTVVIMDVQEDSTLKEGLETPIIPNTREVLGQLRL